MVGLSADREEAAQSRLVDILGTSDREFLWAFNRQSLFSSREEWQKTDQAREKVHDNRIEYVGERLVLLGRQVATAFGLGNEQYFTRNLVRFDNVPDKNGVLRSWWVQATVWPHPNGKTEDMADPSYLEFYRNAARRLVSSWGRPFRYSKPLPYPNGVGADPRAAEDEAREEIKPPQWICPPDQFDIGSLVRNLWRERATGRSIGNAGSYVTTGQSCTFMQIRNLAAELDVTIDHLLREPECEEPIVMGKKLRSKKLEEILDEDYPRVRSIAEALDVSPSSLYGWMRGGNPRAWLAGELCSQLSITPSELFEDVFIV